MPYSEYKIQNPGSYKHYRLYNYLSNDLSGIAIGELAYYESHQFERVNTVRSPEADGGSTWFGNSVHSYENTLVISDREKNSPFGRAYIFNISDDGKTITHEQTLSDADGLPNDGTIRFGNPLYIRNDVLVVGAQLLDTTLEGEPPVVIITEEVSLYIEKRVEYGI